jgi:hypothetical protein
MSLPLLNTASGYDEALRNSVFFERGLHATSICGAVRRSARPSSRPAARPS